jgi:hypothetical protein
MAGARIDKMGEHALIVFSTIFVAAISLQHDGASIAVCGRSRRRWLSSEFPPLVASVDRRRGITRRARWLHGT